MALEEEVLKEREGFEECFLEEVMFRLDMELRLRNLPPLFLLLTRVIVKGSSATIIARRGSEYDVGFEDYEAIIRYSRSTKRKGDLQRSLRENERE